ncbi:MAG: low affinity iron permease family protein [Bacteroidota bacterium]|nr:low affinity iron permease family protein [Bacteroidota bacterium]
MKPNPENVDTYKVSKFSKLFNKAATRITRIAGSPVSSISAVLIILIWLVTGPIFDFSDTWQLVINTGTTIVTFIMVFIIQQSQNKDTTAIQLKLNELLACEEKASNRLVSVEDLTEEELMVLKKFYTHIAKLSQEGKDLHTSHSLDEAENNYRKKSDHHRKHLHKKENE